MYSRFTALAEKPDRWRKLCYFNHITMHRQPVRATVTLLASVSNLILCAYSAISVANND